MSVWNTYTLDEVCEKIYSGGTPSTKHPEYWDGNINWLSSGETSQRFIYDTERKISMEGVNNSSTKLATKGCTVIATAGQGFTRGQASFLMVDTYMNQSVIACKANEEKVLPLYLYYNLDNRYEEFRALSDGTSTRGGLSGAILRRMLINLPPLSEQEKIVSILRSLDMKIEENNKINNNLEQQGAALFKKMFIDENNNNWKYGTLANLGTVVGGSTPSKAKEEYYTNNGIAWITPKDLSGNHSKFISHGANDITELGLKNSSASIMPRGTVLFSSRAPIGYIAIAKNDVTTNQGFKSVIPNVNIGTAYIYYLLKHSIPALESVAIGSTFKEVSGAIMKNFEVIIPDQETLTTFNSFCETLFYQQEMLEQENQYLENLRNVLLPQLLSGKVDCSNVTI